MIGVLVGFRSRCKALVGDCPTSAFIEGMVG